MSGPRLLSDLAAVVGANHVVVDPDVRATYEVDWLGARYGTALAAVRPGSVAEVAGVVGVCAAAGVPIVVQGGNTGLVGGSVPLDGAVVVSTRRLDRLDPVDEVAMQVTAGAGVTIGAVRDHARAVDLDVPVDWGARASATVGGAVNTDAGGSRVVRFGTMRAQVLGVEAVLADGSVVDDLHGLPKRTAGPHLASLLVGSEGTLAVVTAARLRLVPWFRATAAAWVPCRSVDDALHLLGRLRSLPSLDAVEVLFSDAVEVACAHLGVAPPMDPRAAPLFLLVDCAAHADPADELLDALAGHDGVMAVGPAREALYAIRDHITVALSALGTPLKLDVAVPLARLAELVEMITHIRDAADPSARLVVFGHLAEGNLHVNLLGLDPPARDRVREAVLETTIALGGTVSAEHGIGRLKVDWMERQHGCTHIEVLRRLKDSLDPQGLLNPGVLVPRRAAPS